MHLKLTLFASLIAVAARVNGGGIISGFAVGNGREIYCDSLLGKKEREVLKDVEWTYI